MVDNEVIVEETTVETTENKFEVPESFKEKYTENPDRAIEELYKAQHKIVEQKKADKKTAVSETAWLWKDDLENFYQEKRFFEDNKHLEEHREDILKLTSKGNSLEDAKYLMERKDPTIQNRATAQNSNFTSWTPDFNSDTYTMEQLADIGKKNPSKYGELMRDYKAGKIKVNS